MGGSGAWLTRRVGRNPYDGMKPLKVLKAILGNPPPSLEEERFSKHFRDLIETCLQKDPAKR
jgi:serine/threonine protein kinase